MYRTVAAASWLMATKAQVVWTNEAFLCLIDLKKSFAKFFVARATSCFLSFLHPVQHQREASSFRNLV